MSHSSGVPMATDAPARHLQRRRTDGQSLVEFALLLPAFLLILLVAIDFGRVYLGWINLQQMTRVAANYAAEHAKAWSTPDTAKKQTERARYQQLIDNDARLINCEPPDEIGPPTFGSGTSIGDPVSVNISCEFTLATPIISQIFGGTILASASTTYAITEGIVASVPGGGVAPVTPPPIADFSGSPRSGWSPLVVAFTDTSRNAPIAWTWRLSVSPTASGSATPMAMPNNSFAQNPTATYTCEGVPGDICTFGTSLTASNAGGLDEQTKPDYITVTVPPDSGPIAEFTATPRSGVEPLTVAFSFDEITTGVTYATWEWDFDNNGTIDASGSTASHVYSTAGEYDVRLRVTDDTGAANELTKQGFIIVANRICTVPDFGQVRQNSAQRRWSDAGFTTQMNFLPGRPNYKIQTQSLIGGTIDPQPDRCSSNITVGP